MHPHVKKLLELQKVDQEITSLTRDIDALPAEEQKRKRGPQVLLLPGGQMTPFTLDLKAPDYPSYFRIEGDLLGRVTRERKTADTGGRR